MRQKGSSFLDLAGYQVSDRRIENDGSSNISNNKSTFQFFKTFQIMLEGSICSMYQIVPWQEVRNVGLTRF